MPRDIRPSRPVYERARELRHQMTDKEKILWDHLRGRKIGRFKFRRQHPLGPYILDFYCIEKRLVIEVDGGIHVFQQKRDKERIEFLEAAGCRVLRFTNEQVERNLDGVLSTILAACLT